MLVQFRLKNYGPFKDETEFDMRAVKSYKEHPYNLIEEPDGNAYLKVASIYGANASGKSNFVDAYHAFRNIVLYSFSSKDEQGKKSVLEKSYFPFLFDAESEKEDTEFEAVYRDDLYEYKYGFIYNKERICYEWLYRRAVETKRQTVVFERAFDEIKFGSSVRKSCEKYAADIEQDVLVLSFFRRIKLRTTVFKDVDRCIYNILPLKTTGEEDTDDMLAYYFSDFTPEEKEELLAFLGAIDVGIKDIDVEENEENIRVFTYHEDSNGEKKKVPFEIESDGTKKAIAVFSFVKVAIIADKGLIIDELNVQLHPLLLKYIVDLFYCAETKGQLIYTTHDTTLLDKRYMRRDQIWFAEKNQMGESTLFSLAEFKVRNDQSFEKGYLGGAFGGIPILKDFSVKE